MCMAVKSRCRRRLLLSLLLLSPLLLLLQGSPCTLQPRVRNCNALPCRHRFIQGGLPLRNFCQQTFMRCILQQLMIAGDCFSLFMVCRGWFGRLWPRVPARPPCKCWIIDDAVSSLC